MSLSERLWEQNQDLAREARETAFVCGLADGSLPADSFREYVAQDAYFLEAFSRGYALALGRSPDRGGLRDFFDLLSGVLEELKLHASYAARLHIDLERAQAGEATMAYCDFLLATAALSDVGEACAAMTPCMRLYAYLGQMLRAEPASAGPYQEWVDTYAAPEFEQLAATLERLLDRYATDNPRVSAIYRRAMRLEVAFFEAHAPH